MTKTNYEIAAKQTPQGWTEGTINGLQFQAKVYDEGSEYGINEGRVSKLMIWDEAQRKATLNMFNACLLNYDRSWDIKPKTAAARHTLEALLEYLENLPTAETWDDFAAGQPIKLKERMSSGYMADALLKIESDGWGRIYSQRTGQTFRRLDPIAVRDFLESNK